MKKFGKVQIRLLWSLAVLCLMVLGYAWHALAIGSTATVTATPGEVWVTAGETATVTFTGTFTGEPAPREGYSVVAGPFWYDWTGSTHLPGNSVVKQYPTSPSTRDYDFTVSTELYAYHTYDNTGEYHWRHDEITGGDTGYCIIHVRANPTAPAPTPYPTPTYPPYPTPTYPPYPTPTSPSPTPTYPPTPTPVPYPTTPTTSTSWSPLDKPIGYHRVGDGWQADGCMVAPVDHSADCNAATPTPTASPTPTPTPYPTPTYPATPTPTGQPIDPPYPPPYPTPTYPPYPTPTYPPYPTPTYPATPTPTYPPYLPVTSAAVGSAASPISIAPTPTSPTPAPEQPWNPTPTPGPTAPTPTPTASPTPTATPTASPTPQPADKTVAAGARVPCEVQEAQDFDTRDDSDYSARTSSRSYHADGPLSYKWTADKGHFEGSTTNRTATWIAPDDSREAVTAIVKCTIDDPTGPRVNAPETGSHDDDALVREATLRVMPPVVKFGGSGVVGDHVRACAGGIDDHAATDPNPDVTKRNDEQYRAHTRKIELSALLEDQSAPGAPFTLRFVGNKGHDYGDGSEKKTAKLHRTDEPFDEDHPWEESLKVTANSEGKVEVWVLSSDVINKPMLQAILKPVPDGQEPVKLGEIECDFAPSVSIRRFVPKKANGEPLTDPDEEDTGWIFDFPHLVNPDNDDHMTPAKVYLKFKKDEAPSDEQDGNWQFVNDHQVRISIHSVEVVDEDSGEVRTIEGTPAELQRYVFVASQPRGPDEAGEIEAQSQTTAKGETAPQVYVCGGSDLDKVTVIYVQVKDLAEHKE